jgi:hypothetical protein
MLNVAIFIRLPSSQSAFPDSNLQSRGRIDIKGHKAFNAVSKENEMTEKSMEGVRERITMFKDPVAHVRGRIDAEVDPTTAELGTLEHDEWALDEALEETFPASDPPTPPRPGSTMAQRYAVRATADGLRLRRSRAMGWAVIAACVFFAVLRFRRQRD